jgi:Sodium/hydrogen exchanger family
LSKIGEDVTEPVGYLFRGLVVFAVRPELLSAGGTVHLLAELGVVFLLFDIGPHFSTAHVRHEAGDIFGFGSLQVSASTILEHFPKRMTRAGFPCGHESDSRIALEGRPV